MNTISHPFIFYFHCGVGRLHAGKAGPYENEKVLKSSKIGNGKFQKSLISDGRRVSFDNLDFIISFESERPSGFWKIMYSKPNELINFRGFVHFTNFFISTT